MKPTELPHDIAALVAAERPVPTPPDGAAARVRARLDLTLHGGGGGGGVASGASQSLTWLKIAAAVLVVGGGAAWIIASRGAPSRVDAHTPAAPIAVTTPQREPESARLATEPVVAEVVAPAPAKADEPAPAAPTAPTEPGPIAEPTAPAAPAPTAPTRDPAAERKLLEAAQSALVQHDMGAALTALRAHQQRYPRGALVEERLSLSVRAFVLAGRRADAERAAAELERRFPDSIHRAAVQALLREP